MRVDKGKVVLGPLKDEALREFEDKVRKRKEPIIIEKAPEKQRKQGN